MRKIYLVMLSLCVALAANAAADQLYMFGSDEQIGKWDLSKKAQMTQTESGVFELPLYSTVLSSVLPPPALTNGMVPAMLTNAVWEPTIKV